MPRKSAVKKTRKKSKEQRRTMFRYADNTHYDLVMQAVKKSKLPSINSWLIQATVKQARLELKD